MILIDVNFENSHLLSEFMETGEDSAHLFVTSASETRRFFSELSESPRGIEPSVGLSEFLIHSLAEMLPQTVDLKSGIFSVCFSTRFALSVHFLSFTGCPWCGGLEVTVSIHRRDFQGDFIIAKCYF